MATNGGSGSAKPGMSLYANLLDPSANAAPGSISKAPVLFNQQVHEERPGSISSAAQKQQINSAALRFQPTKRPQLASQKAKAKSVIQKAPQSIPPPPPADESPRPEPPKPQTKSTLADWTAADDDDVNGFYGGEKRQRGGRKKRKKNKEEDRVTHNWDDIYDPSRPNTYEEYKNSDERIAELREWKDRLYAHRMARRRDSDFSSESDIERPGTLKNQFPPPGMSFAPPPLHDDPTPPPPPPPPPPASVPDDPTGEDAYLRRMALSGRPVTQPPPAQETAAVSATPLPQPTSATAPPSTISRAAVRYSLPAAPTEIPTSEEELVSALESEQQEVPKTTDTTDAASTKDASEPRSLRPGQKGFAQRLMSKYGWTKGTGLGADNSGILNALSVKVEKAKKKSDTDGGGTVGPKGGVGRIVGGKKKAVEGEKEGGKFGLMSEVVVLRGMIDGMDLRQEVERGGLIQEIGEECGDKYGRVERVYIHQPADDAPPRVFIRFTSQLSALRAVNALEGRIFNGNTIIARFFDTAKFEDGSYDDGVKSS